MASHEAAMLAPPFNRDASGAAASRSKNPTRRAEARRLAAEEAGAILRAGGMLRPRHLGALLSLSDSTLWQMVRDGRLPPPARLGSRCTVWPASAVRDVLERLGAEAGQ